MAGGPSRDDDADTDTGEVWGLYVEPDQARRGVGRALMSEGEEQLRQRGCARATLWVLAGNQSGRRFYERCGWGPDGSTRVEQRDDAALSEVRYVRSLLR